MAEKIELHKEKWLKKMTEVILGTGQNEGGHSSRIFKIGGEETLPFLHFEGKIPNYPLVALEVWDTPPKDWPDALNKAYGKTYADSVDWGKRAVENFGADLICLKLMGTHPEKENKTAEEAASLVKEMIETVKLPLIIVGPGPYEKENEVLIKCGEAARGEKCLLSTAKEDNYRSLVANCLANGHNIIAQSPIDVNIAKQLNILISELHLPLDRIVIDPLAGGLGYGLEYTYSVMERIRLGGLMGDEMLAMPFYCDVGTEAWKVKEVKLKEKEMSLWGDEEKRGILWEVINAFSLFQAGADILVVRHPQSVRLLKEAIKDLMEGKFSWD